MKTTKKLIIKGKNIDKKVEFFRTKYYFLNRTIIK